MNSANDLNSLLDQLRSSQVWQQAVAAPAVETAIETRPALDVATLLSQLGPTQSTDRQRSEIATERSGKPNNPVDPRPRAEAPSVDLEAYSYQQALPLLAQLSGDVNFINTIKELKDKQDALERQLWDEREAIHEKYRDKVTAAKTKANLTGSAISKHDATMLADSYRRELTRFDAQRALAAWAALVTQQQETLRQLGVPAVFPSNIPTDLQRQMRIVQVLEGIITE